MFIIYKFLNLCVSRFKIFTLSLLLSFLFSFSSAQDCNYVNPCKCVFQNGSVIDLTSLGDRNEVRWNNVVPKLNETYRYYYNPCFNFKLGSVNSECAKGVAVCRVSTDNKSFCDCGSQEHAFFSWNKENKSLNLIYRTASRTTNVILVCSENAYEPTLDVCGEVHPHLYEMTLTTRCACPNLCHNDSLSAGSVLVIIFLTFVSLYLILGIVHSSLTRGAHGWELIPHHEFWTDFPLLVRDGCVFVINGCKPETAYERI